MRLAIALPIMGTSALALAVALRKQDHVLSEEQESKLKLLLRRYREQLLCSPERLAEVESEFIAQMRQGLANRVVVDGKRMMMLPTYVTRLPDGTETGECFALDLGGTNFRVMYVRLGEGKGEVAACEVEEFSLPREIYTGPGDKLFDYLATTLKAFIGQHQTAAATADSTTPSPTPGAPVPEADLPVLGFCFSFAVEQDGLASGRLLDWTKGFSCPGVVGNDPVALLSLALRRAGRPCRVAALLNDTVGVLAAQRYLDSDTEVGVIIGTGTNACYVEHLRALTKWAAPEGAATAGDGRTAINMEWGAFFSPQLPRCMEDLQVDAASPNPGKYLFEKLISGMSLGEAARRILFTLATEVPGLLTAVPKRFCASEPDAPAAASAPAAAVGAGGSSSAAVAAKKLYLPGRLVTPGSLSSASLSAIVEDRTWRLRRTREILEKDLGVHKPSVRAAEVAQEVCTMIARRSAQLTSLAVMAILRHNGWAAATPPRPVTVAFDGGVYERFGAYRTMLAESVSELLGERAKDYGPLIKFVLSHDGSAMGAAVLAAAAVTGLGSGAATAAVAL